MNYICLFIVVLIGIGVSGCVDSSMDSGASIDGDWLIPTGQVFDGGWGKDGIPSIDNPKFISVDEVPTYLRDDDLVVGIRIGNEVRAYPHPILDWHEIVNDEIDGIAFSVTYCPLTGSALIWNRQLLVADDNAGSKWSTYQIESGTHYNGRDTVGNLESSVSRLGSTLCKHRLQPPVRSLSIWRL